MEVFMNSIFERTSVRKYTDAPIEKEKLDLILRAGFCAPSAHNFQPWEFVVVQNKDKLKEMSTLTPWARPLAGASLGMVFCCDTTRNPNMSRCQQDCAAATENMLLEAKELGVGSVWIGVYDDADRVEKVRNAFSLPEHIVPLWMAAFGYPAETPAVKEKYREERIHYEEW